MKRITLWGLMAVLALLAAGCDVKGTYGLDFAGTFACTQDDYPSSGSSADLKTGGTFDIAMTDYVSNSTYYVRVGASNVLEATADTTGSTAEGNYLRLKYYEVKFRTPAGWDDLPTLKVPMSASLAPGSSFIGYISILNGNVVEAIKLNMAKNAYKNLQNVAVTEEGLHPLARPAIGAACTDGSTCAADLTCANGICSVPCKPSNAAEVCGGYACINGGCAIGCTLETGCATKNLGTTPNSTNDSDYVNPCIDPSSTGFKTCTDPFEAQPYRCELGPLPQCYYDNTAKRFICADGRINYGQKGICRQSCSNTSDDCPAPVKNAKGELLFSYECVNNMCLPKTAYDSKGTPEPAELIPSQTETIVVEMTAVAEANDGGDVRSATQTYNLDICRNCLIDYNPAKCSSSSTDWLTTILDRQTAQGYDCDSVLPYQDFVLDCEWLSSCYNSFCK